MRIDVQDGKRIMKISMSMTTKPLSNEFGHGIFIKLERTKMLSEEELNEVLEELRTGESDDSPFVMEGAQHAKELQTV